VNQYTYSAEQFQEIFETQFTWLNGFMRNVRRFPERPAVIDAVSGRSWTYQTLNAAANQLANALQKDHIQKNDVIMFALRNTPSFIFCYLAAHKLGAVACPVNYRQGAGEMALVIQDSRPKAFIYDNAEHERCQDALFLSNCRPAVVLTADGKQDNAVQTLEEYMSRQPENDPPMTFSPHMYDETTRLYTSGTTNCPKGVPINNINEILSAHDVMMNFPLCSHDRTMNMTPWFHRGGIHSGGPCATLYAGGAVVALRDFSPRSCLLYVAQYEISFLIGVPSVIELLARVQENSPIELSALRGLIAMGAPLDPSACERYMELLTPYLFNGYGTTETFWNTFLKPCDLPMMAGSAGCSCVDDDVRLVALHEDGERAEPDEIVPQDGESPGEIIIFAPTKSAFCYFNNPAMTEQKFYRGFLYTGDVGTWDESGFITIQGRKDDMIVSAGENIYPSQIEAVLNQHPKVLESAVIGVPDDLRGQAIEAFIIPSDDTVSPEELRAYCMRSPLLSSGKCPKVYHMVSDLPRTATGKLQHFRLR